MLGISGEKTVVLLLLALSLVACNQKSQNKIVQPGDDNFAVQELNLGDLNNKIQNSQIKNLDQTIAMVVPEEESEHNLYKYTVEKLNVTENEALVIVTETGLADDSIAGQKTKIQFHKQGDYWLVQKVSVSFQCQNGRGHTNWSSDFCQ